MPWVKTSLAPGSKVVTEYLDRAGLTEPLAKLGFDLVGYGCTTCIGNSGPLPEEISQGDRGARPRGGARAVGQPQLRGPHPPRGEDELPRLAAAVRGVRAGGPHGHRHRERAAQAEDDVYLRDIWPTQQEVNDTIEQRDRVGHVPAHLRRALFEGDDNWKELEIPEGDRYAWDDESTYVKQPPYFEDMPAEAAGGLRADRGRAGASPLLGDSVTTDHISPAGAIKKDSPAGEYLIEHGVEQRDFNSYGSRRGNHEVMMRGTFANIRLRNLLAPGHRGRLHEEGRRGEADLRRRDEVRTRRARRCA